MPKDMQSQGYVVRTHIPQLEEDKLHDSSEKKRQAENEFDEHDPSVVTASEMVSYQIAEGAGFENNRMVHTLVFPLASVMVLWAWIKTLICACFAFIRAGNLGGISDSGWKKILQYKLEGFMKVYWAMERSPDKITPKYASIFFDRFSSPLKEIRRGSASWKALDIIYHWDFKPALSLEKILANFWIGMRNAQAVRNRVRLIKRDLLNEILSLKKEKVEMLSIACGSAEAVLEVVSAARVHGVEVHVTLVDLDSQALRYAEQLAEKYGVKDLQVTIRTSVRGLERKLSGAQFDIIEMLGFLDYLQYSKAVNYILRIRQMLKEGGTFFTCNIMPNFERPFLRWIIYWPMIYRTPHQVAQIMVAAGYDKEQVSLVSEPQEIHVIARCTK